jgi:hypothetical protein
MNAIDDSAYGKRDKRDNWKPNERCSTRPSSPGRHARSLS